MRLVSFDGGFGRVERDTVVPMGVDLVEYLASGAAIDGTAVPLGDVALLAPVPRPGKIICVGRNYLAHIAELDKDVPVEPILFCKFANSVVPSGATVRMPPQTEMVDWEAELGVVIGRTANNVSRDEALDYVAGYTCTNDLSARDLQRRTGQWTRGKAIDGFLPMGPALVTPDEVGDPHDLRVRCLVDGEVQQDGNTSEMIFDIPTLISFISETITLEPGDVIATGTPPGVGAGQDPPRYLQPGETVVVEIERVGRLSTVMAR